MLLIALILSSLITDPGSELLLEAGYTQQRSTFRHASRGATVHVRSTTIPTEVTPASYVSRAFDASAQVPTEAIRNLNSGLPLGRVHRFGPGAASTVICGASSTTFVWVSMMVKQRRVDGVPQPVSPILPEEQRMLEAVARWFLATKTNGAYRATTVRTGSRSYSGRRSPQNHDHVDARQWALDRGYTYRLNKQTAIAVIEREDGNVLLPAGSPKVKIGAQWFDIGDIVIASEDRIMLPVAIINRL